MERPDGTLVPPEAGVGLPRRSDMLDQVKAEVDLMNQDLAAFAAALSPPAR